MEDTQVVVPESGETIATITPGPDAPVADAPKPTDDAPKPSDSTEPTAPVAFEPNFKVKAYDKEFEIPEEFRGLIKDADSEKKIKDIFERAYGMDGMKERYGKQKEEYTKAQDVLSSYSKQDEAIGFLTKCIEKKDYDTYFDTLGIPEKDLQEWMYKKLQVAELPPEQRAIYNRERELQKRAYELEAENQKYKSEMSNSQEQELNREGERRFQELNNMVSQKPDVQQVAKAFDARKGDGAFINLVKEIGITAFQTKGKDLTVAEAVNQVMDLLGPANVQAAKVASVAEAKAKPVLPIVEGKQVSPTARKPSSVADLRKMVAEMNSDTD